jgi:hypothetical protein
VLRIFNFGHRDMDYLLKKDITESVGLPVRSFIIFAFCSVKQPNINPKAELRYANKAGSNTTMKYNRQKLVEIV